MALMPESLRRIADAEQLTIERTWTPRELAKELTAALDRRLDTHDNLKTHVVNGMKSGGNDYFQMSYIAEAVGVAPQTACAEIAKRAEYDPASTEMANMLEKIDDHENVAGMINRVDMIRDLARGLNGHMGEADAVAGLDGWELAGVEYEGDAVDLLGPERPELGRRWTAQLKTSEADDAHKSAYSTMKNKRDKVEGNGDHPGVDAFIVLHGFEDEQKYGVGVTNLTEDTADKGDVLKSPRASGAAYDAHARTDR